MFGVARTSAPRIVTSASQEPDSPPVARFELAEAIARVEMAPTVISPSKSDTVRSVDVAEAAPWVDAVARARAHEEPVVTIVSPYVSPFERTSCAGGADAWPTISSEPSGKTTRSASALEDALAPACCASAGPATSTVTKQSATAVPSRNRMRHRVARPKARRLPCLREIVTFRRRSATPTSRDAPP